MYTPINQEQSKQELEKASLSSQLKERRLTALSADDMSLEVLDLIVELSDRLHERQIDRQEAYEQALQTASPLRALAMKIGKFINREEGPWISEGKVVDHFSVAERPALAEILEELSDLGLIDAKLVTCPEAEPIKCYMPTERGRDFLSASRASE